MNNVLTAHGKRWNWSTGALLTAAFVMTVPTLVILLGGGTTGTPAVWVRTAMASLRQGPGDNLHGGLLVEGFDQESCHSRYQSAMYRRNPGRQPSEHLVSKLRRHEALQRRCGPGTAAYSDALEQLKSGKNAASPECKYLVSISYRGLGNRILAAASAFLYALLTDRVLLVDPSNDMGELFCEPFPNTSWLLPPGFPLWSFNQDTPERYGRMRENGVLRTDVSNGGSPANSKAADMPAFAYIHLDWNQTDHDQLFFCDEDQRLLSNFQWLVMRTDSYIVPGLFLVDTFRQKLATLFPEPDAVFHHLGRYLFHPTNHVWGLVTRYYSAHLGWAQRRVGIQVRVFPRSPESPELLERITKCTQKEGLLPRVVDTEEPAVTAAPPTGAGRGVKSNAVVITSLKAWYYEQMKGMYWENATAGGEVVVVSQPSHEEYQHYGVKSHEYKAWAEIYLLSLTDLLVTTGKSTFGYVAQGLAGMRPWVLLGQANGTAGNNRPPCSRDVSPEPCFHIAPLHDCKRRRDSGKIVPHVRHCEDVPTGLKLVDRKEW
ncbi:hypothetical protein SEVIR_4G080800v4 [Setaria viridis]|uniref:Fucosyltransferase n=2 Tax=Setaria TaxID=4554 RepID=K3Y3J3_SETIT|nr:galactoside 2-alpha-L-fucosyltransferase [Setaria italica]XP_034591608.1 galactoside 2-alpha-L-fucosyltransferase-like [Setaria viridis]RCV20742.1 hypothetical protein SETIT_4G081700v2 [Setaria italica]TKW20339.1 hypothetical protein SEVIR_4G080800v2 [Setaria viridis]